MTKSTGFTFMLSSRRRGDAGALLTHAVVRCHLCDRELAFPVIGHAQPAVIARSIRHKGWMFDLYDRKAIICPNHRDATAKTALVELFGKPVELPSALISATTPTRPVEPSRMLEEDKPKKETPPVETPHFPNPKPEAPRLFPVAAEPVVKHAVTVQLVSNLSTAEILRRLGEIGDIRHFQVHGTAGAPIMEMAAPVPNKKKVQRTKEHQERLTKANTEAAAKRRAAIVTALADVLKANKHASMATIVAAMNKPGVPKPKNATKWRDESIKHYLAEAEEELATRPETPPPTDS